MIRRCGYAELDAIDATMKDESVYPFITDDGSPPSIEFSAQPMLGLGSSYYLMDEVSRLFVFHKACHKVYVVHTCVPEGLRGAGAFRAGEAAVNWMFSHTDAEKIVSMVPEYQRGTLLYAMRCGFKKEGFLKRCWFKDGEACGLHIVGKEK